MVYNFNEKETEQIYNKDTKQVEELKVWQSPKYKESKDAAIKMIESGKYNLTTGDFWILMNATKTGKMAYTGLIISHNGCLKINDNLEAELKFKPECLTRTDNAYADSLIYEYNCAEQGLYEVGEVNIKNCKNDYPFAMAFKRCFDRVVLKNSKLAYAGIYSDSEADSFKEQIDETRNEFTFKSGKYAGKTIEEVGDELLDYDYLSMVYSNENCPEELKGQIGKFLDERKYFEKNKTEKGDK